MAFYTKFEPVRSDGTRHDLDPRLKQVAEDRACPGDDEVRFEFRRGTGHFVTESSMHISEYNALYLNKDRLDVSPTTSSGSAKPPPLRRPDRRMGRDQEGALRRRAAGGGAVDRSCRRYHPGHGDRQAACNQRQRAQPGACAGTSGRLHRRRALHGGPARRATDASGSDSLASGLDHGPSINVQRAVGRAARAGKREHIYHAAMLGPQTVGALTLDHIWAPIDDLIAAYRSYLPQDR